MIKKIGFFAIIFLIAALAAVAYVKVPAFQEKIAAITEENFNEENIYSDLRSVSNRLNDEILKGTDTFTIYLKDMDINEINQINSYLDGIFGSGESYQQVGMVGSAYKKVTITIKKTTNYYAYAAYTKGEAIPETETKAKELYNVLDEILRTQITDGMTDYEKELALHDYLVTHCIYSEDVVQQTENDIYRAYGALVNQDAVCNGYAEAMQLLLLCAGINTRFVIGTADGVDHAWNLVELDGKWYHLDTTWDDPKPDQGENTVHPYFNVTDAVMEQNHTWDKENYPQSDDMDYNYYVQSNTYFKDFESFKQMAFAAMVRNGQKRYEAVIENYRVNEDEMQFIFEGNFQYNSVSWQTFEAGAYSVLVLKGQ